jgi:ubiquinone/menaquinone biosynthesis C-methylase UbiE
MQEQHEDQFVENFFNDRKPESVLDLPVGEGRFFRHYSKVQRLTGVDSSDEMLAQARKNLHVLPSSVEAKLERADIFRLPFENGEFDCAVVFGLFHRISEEMLPDAVHELTRVTAANVVLQTYAFTHTWRTKLGKLSRRLLKGGNEPSFDHEQKFIDALFSDCGFSRSFSLVLDQYYASEVRGTVYSKR